MMEEYKFLSNVKEVERRNFVPLSSNSRTRGQPMKQLSRRFSPNKRRWYFTQRATKHVTLTATGYGDVR